MTNKKSTSAYENKNSEKYGYEGNIVKSVQPVKKDKKTNIHEDHRKRVRARFLREGLDSFEDHNVMELFLFYGIPFKDVNETAHRLIDTFGSLSAVFDAKFSELCKVDGIGENTATLIKLMPELFRRYETDKLNKDSTVLNSAELVAQYISKYYKGVNEERMYLLCLDSNCRLLRCDLISTGTTSFTRLDNRTIAQFAYSVDAANLIFVHNHPSGVAAPSRQDTDATIHAVSIFREMGLRLSDHVIIGSDNTYFSFKKSPKFSFIFD